MVDYTVSILPHLEPFIGIAFALNLAYIGLPRFRYGDRIQQHVCEKFTEVSDAPKKIKDDSWYKTLSRMRSIKTPFNKDDRVGFPKESWVFKYLKLFRPDRDRTIVIVLSTLLAILLALGSAHSAGHYGEVIGLNTLWVFSKPMFSVWFIFVTFSALCPVWFVSMGNAVVKDACAYTDREIKKMKMSFQDDVKNLAVPKPKKPTT